MWISHVVSVDGCFYVGHIPGWSTVQCQFSCAAFSEARCIEYGLQEHSAWLLFARSVPVYWKPNWPQACFIHTVLPDISDNYQLKPPFAPLLSQVSFLPPFQQYLADTYYLLEALLFHGLI